VPVIRVVNRYQWFSTADRYRWFSISPAGLGAARLEESEQVNHRHRQAHRQASIIDTHRPLERTAGAIRHSESRRARGKIIVTVDLPAPREQASGRRELTTLGVTRAPGSCRFRRD
jgi:hypothetical protein